MIPLSLHQTDKLQGLAKTLVIDNRALVDF
jgi:hypothetical protein